jgi:hypothetical protein
MALYFAADHVVWAHQIGLLTDKRSGERAQKLSLWSWALGSVTTMILEANTILAVSDSPDALSVYCKGGAVESLDLVQGMQIVLLPWWGQCEGNHRVWISQGLRVVLGPSALWPP